MLIPLLSDARKGALTPCRVLEFLLARDRRLNLDFESSHLLGALTPHLVEAFPDARIVLLVRQCENWIDSMINDQLNLRSWEGYESWIPVYDSYLKDDDEDFPAEEGVLRDLSLYPLRSYVRGWCDQILGIMAVVPAERLMMIRTDALASSGDQLADFLGIKSADIDFDRSHAY